MIASGRLLAGAALLAGTASLARTALETARAVGAPGDGHHRNEVPTRIVPCGRADVLRATLARGRTGYPAGAVPLAPVNVPNSAAALAATWYGHAGVLLEIDGHRVLTDPMWSDRASPSRHLGPRRMHPVPAPLEHLPELDAILISHDHYDHLDAPTIAALGRRSDVPFLVPRGVGAHLRRWGVPADRIMEAGWDDELRIADLTVTCVQARHFSGRGLRRNTTLWCSWVVRGPGHTVFFAGDTGYSPAFAELGARHRPFDLTLLPIGAYSDLWPEVHLTPEQALLAHHELGGGLLLPVHWATFNLGFHPWAEPVLRLCAAATGDRLLLPRPGERIDAAAPPRIQDWWSTLS